MVKAETLLHRRIQTLYDVQKLRMSVFINDSVVALSCFYLPLRRKSPDRPYRAKISTIRPIINSPP